MSRKTIYKLVIFFLFAFVLDRVYGYFAKYLAEHPNGGELYLDKFICDSTTADVLIFGSSKAQNQYNPQIIEDTLGMSVFNCGRHGMGMIYHYGRWKIISQRYIPKVLIFETLPIVDYMVRDDNSIFINPLRLYYGKIEGIDSLFWEIDPTEKYKMLSKTYQYHTLFDYISSYQQKEWLKNGYVEPGDQVLDPKTIIPQDVVYELDSVKWRIAEKFVAEVSSKTTVIFVVSPMYSFHEDYGGLYHIKKLCKKYNVAFIDHFCDPDFVDNPNLYIDMAHFNKNGSVKWSKLIASELKKILSGLSYE